MRFFRRFFKRRTNSTETEDHFIVEENSKNTRKQSLSRQYRSEHQSRVSSPEQRDDHVDHNGGAMEGSAVSMPVSVPTPSGSEVGHHPMGAQLSRITEVPTLLSSSTAAMTGTHHPVMERVLPPPAREAAFHGPPRFDWMDIVSLAFIVTRLWKWQKQRGLSISHV